MASSSELRRKAILSFLGGKSEPITASELADKFGVSERTIYRDFDSLRESGVSIGAQRSAGGGFQLSFPAQSEVRSSTKSSGTGSAHPTSRISLVGRNADLAILEETSESAARGTGTAVVLTGEAGIGKSRLASEFTRDVSGSGALLLTACCYESSGSPGFWPWINLIENAAKKLALTQLSLGRDQIDHLAQIVPTLFDSGPAHPKASAWKVENPGEEEFLLNQAIVRLFVELSQRRRLVLLIEDIHWADRQSLGALEMLVDLINETSITLLCTMRNVDVNDDGSIAQVRAGILRSENCKEIYLSGLSKEEISDLCAMSPSVSVSPENSDEIFRQTEGNPFFAIEILLLLEREGGTDSPLSLRLPDTVKAVISRRLDFVSEICRSTLTAGSVLGREFSFDEVHYLLGRVAEEDLLSAIDEALEAGLIEEVSSRDERYQFSHAIIERTLYESQSASRRARSHAQAAVGLENLYGAGADRIPNVLAHHLLSAGPNSDSERVGHYCRLAGDAALKSLAFEEALRYYDISISNTDADTPSDVLGDLYRGKGSAEYLLGIAPQWLESLDKAIDNYERAESPGKIVELTATRWGTGFGRAPRLPEFHARGLELAEPESSDYVLIRANFADQLFLQKNDIEASTRIQKELLPIAERIGAYDACALLCIDMALGFGCQLEFDSSKRYLESAGNFATKSGNAAVLHQYHHLSIVSSIGRGDLAVAEDHIGAFEDLAKSAIVAGKSIRGNLDRFNAALALFRGEWDRVIDLENEIIRTHPERVHVARFSAMIEALCGDMTKATEICLEVYKSDYHGSFSGDIGFDHVLCELALTTSDLQIADTLDQAAESIKNSDKIPLALIRASCLQGIAAVLREDRLACERYYAEILPHKGYFQYNLGPGAPDRLLGVLATVIGNYDEAEQQFEDARLLCESAESQPWLALTLRDYAVMCLRRDGPGDRGKAQQLIQEAVVICDRFGMTPITIHLATLEAQAATGGRPSSRNPAGLTNREIEILQHLVVGTTNRNIANELVITENTVVRHVANIFAKIGATNRTEAASWAVGEGLTKDAE